MKKKNSMGGVLVLLVFAVFVVSVMLVLLTGADVVQKLNRRDRSSYEQRTLIQYLTTRIRQADARDMVSVRDFDGQDALVLSQDIEDVRYETLVYCWDGYLRELFIEEGLEIDAAFGEMILPAADVQFEDCGTYILADITMADGTQQSMMLTLRAERGTAQ